MIQQCKAWWRNGDTTSELQYSMFSSGAHLQVLTRLLAVWNCFILLLWAFCVFRNYSNKFESMRHFLLAFILCGNSFQNFGNIIWVFFWKVGCFEKFSLIQFSKEVFVCFPLYENRNENDGNLELQFFEFASKIRFGFWFFGSNQSLSLLVGGL